MAITPNVRTVCRIGLGGKVPVSRSTHLRPEARDLGRGVVRGAGQSSGVQLVGAGDAWVLQETYADPSQLAKSSVESGVLREADVNLAPSLIGRNTFHNGADLPSLGTASSVVTEGVNAFRRRVGAAWDGGGLTTIIRQPDADADVEQAVPLDRILESKVAYPENCPFLVRLRLPRNLDVGLDTVANFYFGGAASVTPQEVVGGRFCLTLRGDGAAVLKEWEEVEDPEAEDPWKDRYRFTWSSGDHRNLLYLRILPYGRDRIAFFANEFALSKSPFGGYGAVETIGSLALNVYEKKQKPTNLFIDQERKTGHTHTRTATGAGVVMLDHRRAPRADVLISRGKFRTLGTLIDGPFRISEGTPLGSSMTVRLDSSVLPNGVLSVAVHEADTHTALLTDSAGDFLTTSARYYYLKFTFSSPDGVQTPVLRGASIDIAPGFAEITGDPLLSPTWGTQITGPGTEPDSERANLAIKDRRGAYSLLRSRSRIHSDVVLVNATTGLLVSRLFEGEIAQATAKRRGTPTHLPDWFDYELTLAGMWPTVKEQWYTGADLVSFLQDPNGPINPDDLDMEVIPWKVTDTIRFLLGEAGVPEDEIDVFDSPVRFWSSQAAEDTIVLYGTDLSALISRLAKDYLGSVFLRDPNAGPRGMWRLLRNPQEPFTNRLATLYTVRPGGFTNVHPATRADAFGGGTVLFEDDSFDTWVEPPECNHIIVRGVGEAPDGSGILRGEWISPHINNPTHPDYLEGKIVTFSHGPDVTLTTPSAVRWQIRTIRDRTRARKAWKGRTALLLVTNPQDPQQTYPRPLRINDLVVVNNGEAAAVALLKSVDPTKSTGSDKFWKQDLTGVFLWNPSSGADIVVS